MDKRKVVISIDASSSATGYAVWDAETKQYISSSVRTNENAKKQDWQDRVKWMTEQIDKLYANAIMYYDVTQLILNLGYLPSNGVDTGSLGLKIVQDYIIKLFCVDSDASYTPVLDNSWIGALAQLSGYTGNKNELKKRPVKKLYTVMWAIQFKHGIDLNGEVNNFNNKGADYSIVHDGLEYNMTDDEADAIISGYTFLNSMVKDTTIISRAEKNKRLRIEKLKSSISAIKKRAETLSTWAARAKKEIDRLQDKDREMTKTTKKSIDLRWARIDMWQSEMSELKEKYTALIEELEKEK